MSLVGKPGGPSSTRYPAAAVSSHPNSIPLFLINGVATVWDAQTAATLHCEHDVSGLRAGTLPGVAQQNGFLGLPMTLMQEETAYLVSQGIAHLIPISTHPTLPSPSQIAAHTASRVARLQAIEARSRAEEEVKAREREAAFEKGGEKARAKREARARAKAEQAAARVAGYADIEGGQGTMEGAVLFGGEDSATSSTVPPYSTFESSGATRETAKPITGAHFHAFPSHPHFPLLVEGEPITSLPHRLFPFPSTPRERALLAAFTSLQRLGLRMGLGPRFGGEYLIYPGDYLRYHAHFTSQVLVRNEAIRPAEIVAWGRLGTGTKKAGLLCCWDDGVRGTEEEEGKQEWEGHGQKEGQVEYYSLEWASFG